MGALVGLGRRTVTGMLTTTGRQFVDWSADYRVFGHGRFCVGELFSVPRRAVLENLDSEEPFVAMMDDTLIRKKGRKVSGTSWRRDPLGPPFCTNFIWGQRFLQVSAALPEGPGAARARAIPIDLAHCPSPRKPRKNASSEDWALYKLAQKQTNISRKGAERLWHLRNELDQDNAERKLLMVADGGFTNGTVLKSMPPRTEFIGRLRKDAKLYSLPGDEAPRRGRKRAYGDRLSTPEEMRRNKSIPWQKVRAHAAGEMREFQVKSIGPVRWRSAGGGHDLRLVIIRPLGYRLTKQSPLNYRNPAYLICTDPNLPLEKVLQSYIWRWEIEVNFRDEKTLLGIGQAQVRTEKAVEFVPVLLVAAYAMLLVAGHRVYKTGDKVFPKPKWRKKTPNSRMTTEQLIGLTRIELWSEDMGLDNISSFVSQVDQPQKPEKIGRHLPAAILYATG